MSTLPPFGTAAAAIFTQRPALFVPARSCLLINIRNLRVALVQVGLQVVVPAHLLHSAAVHLQKLIPLQRAICEAYGIVINVITSDQQHWFMRYEPEGTQPKKSVEVFVTYIAPIHYNAVR